MELRRLWKKLQNGPVKTGLLAFLLFLSFGSVQARIPMGYPENEEQGIHITIGGFHFEDKLLVFEYEVKFPGVTDLIMTDANGDEIWRNRYLDDKAGAQKIAINTAKLQSGGTYVFRFEFKRDKILRAVTLP